MMRTVLPALSGAVLFVVARQLSPSTAMRPPCSPAGMSSVTRAWRPMRASIPVFASRVANHRAIRGLSSHKERRLPPQKKRTCTSQLPPKRLGRMATSAPTPKQAKMKPGVMTSKTKRMSAARSHSCHMGRRESNSGIVDKCLVRWSCSKVNQTALLFLSSSIRKIGRDETVYFRGRSR